MTPEEVESKLQGLKTPEPSEGLRARCLAPQRPASRSRMALSLAASFLVVALAGWLILTPTPPIKHADGILVDPGTPSIPRPDDPRLQEKVDAMFLKNPGKAILVVRVRELKNGAFHPVTKGVNLEILLQPLDQETTRAPEGPRAVVDAEGTFLFVVAPGRYGGRGYRSGHDEGNKLSFTWEYQDLTVVPGDVLNLSDAIFAPWMEWAAPDEGSKISLKAGPSIGWKAYAEVRAVRVEVGRVIPGRDGHDEVEVLGSLQCACPKDNRIALSDLLKVVRSPFKAGETLEVTLEGFDGEGKKLTGCKTKRRFTLKD